MSSIYEKDIKGIRKELKLFGRTAYGKTIFLIAYLVPVALFCSMIILGVLAVVSGEPNIYASLPRVFVGFVLSFILANAYYYKELRIFTERKK